MVTGAHCKGRYVLDKVVLVLEEGDFVGWNDLCLVGSSYHNILEE